MAAGARARRHERVDAHSAEGDVRIYSEGEMREILGTWFGSVSWRRIGLTSCVAIARKD